MASLWHLEATWSQCYLNDCHCHLTVATAIWMSATDTWWSVAATGRADTHKWWQGTAISMQLQPSEDPAGAIWLEVSTIWKPTNFIWGSATVAECHHPPSESKLVPYEHYPLLFACLPWNLFNWGLNGDTLQPTTAYLRCLHIESVIMFECFISHALYQDGLPLVTSIISSSLNQLLHHILNGCL